MKFQNCSTIIYFSCIANIASIKILYFYQNRSADRSFSHCCLHWHLLTHDVWCDLQQSDKHYISKNGSVMDDIWYCLLRHKSTSHARQKNALMCTYLTYASLIIYNIFLDYEAILSCGWRMIVQSAFDPIFRSNVIRHKLLHKTFLVLPFKSIYDVYLHLYTRRKTTSNARLTNRTVNNIQLDRIICSVQLHKEQTYINKSVAPRVSHSRGVHVHFLFYIQNCVALYKQNVIKQCNPNLILSVYLK